MTEDERRKQLEAQIKRWFAERDRRRALAKRLGVSYAQVVRMEKKRNKSLLQLPL